MKITKAELVELIREELELIDPEDFMMMDEDWKRRLRGLMGRRSEQDWQDIATATGDEEIGEDPTEKELDVGADVARTGRELEAEEKEETAASAQKLEADVMRIKGLIGQINTKPEVTQLLGVVLSLDFPPEVWGASAESAVRLALTTAATAGDDDMETKMRQAGDRGGPRVPKETIERLVRQVTNRLRGALTGLARATEDVRSAAQESRAGERVKSGEEVSAIKSRIASGAAAGQAPAAGAGVMTPREGLERYDFREELIERVLANLLA